MFLLTGTVFSQSSSGSSPPVQSFTENRNTMAPPADLPAGQGSKRILPHAGILILEKFIMKKTANEPSPTGKHSLVLPV